jgi:hypothetical protein
VYDFSSAEFESGFWVESSLMVGDTWVSNVQYDGNQTQGYLVQFNVVTKTMAPGLNATYCWAMFLDAADATNNTLLCVADDAMQATEAAELYPAGFVPQPPADAAAAAQATDAVWAAHVASARSARAQRRARRRAAGPPLAPDLIRIVSVYRINRATGAQSRVGAFPPGYEEDIDVAYDSARQLIVASLQNAKTNADVILTFNVTAGKVDGVPVPVPYTTLTYAYEFNAAAGNLVAVASTYNASKSAWNTFFGTLDASTAALTPVGPLNGTFAAWEQFNDIDVMVPSLGTFFFTAFAMPAPDQPVLYLLGVETDTGAVGYSAVVRNPFIDIDYHALAPGAAAAAGSGVAVAPAAAVAR